MEKDNIRWIMTINIITPHGQFRTILIMTGCFIIPVWATAAPSRHTSATHASSTLQLAPCPFIVGRRDPTPSQQAQATIYIQRLMMSPVNGTCYIQVHHYTLQRASRRSWLPIASASQSLHTGLKK